MPPRGVAYSFSRGLYSATVPGTFQANPTIVPGDFTISKDNGPFVNLTNLPLVSPVSSVLVLFRLTAVEMSADHIAVLGVDQAGGQWTQFLENITTTDLAAASLALAAVPSVPLVPVDLPRVQILDNAGVPIPGALIMTYAAGTTTPLATYVDGLGAATNTNPIVADAGGFCDIWLPVGLAYKLQVRTPAIPGPSVDVYPAVDNIVITPEPTLATLPGWSADAGQGNATMDPGEPGGTEVLAGTAAEELEQLRFVLQEMKGTANWRTSVTTKTRPCSFLPGPGALGGALPDGVDSTVVGTWLVPPDYAGGDVTLFYLQRASSTAGAFAIRHVIYRFRDNTGVAVLLDVDAPGVITDLNSHLVARAIAAANVLAGDFLRFDVLRLALSAAAADTNTGLLVVDGFYATYNGYAARD